jgi:hypothetical protein
MYKGVDREGERKEEKEKRKGKRVKRGEERGGYVQIVRHLPGTVSQNLKLKLE